MTSGRRIRTKSISRSTASTPASTISLTANAGTITIPTNVNLENTYTFEVLFGTELKTYDVTFDGIYDTTAFIDAYGYDGDDLGAVVQRDDHRLPRVGSDFFLGRSQNLRLRHSRPARRQGCRGDRHAFPDRHDDEEREGNVDRFPPRQPPWQILYLHRHQRHQDQRAGRPVREELRRQRSPRDGRRLQSDQSHRIHLRRPSRLDAQLHGRDHLRSPRPRPHQPLRAGWSTPSHAAYRGKFLGFTVEGTTYQGVSTGIDHIKELGVTHVQILPFFDYGNAVDESGSATQFNWGYMPLNYNCLEGYYATNPYARRRPRERIQAVDGDDVGKRTARHHGRRVQPHRPKR
ncbi:MAG: hypothetical protein MZU97_10060 [Bacillus subtilis]|nr:hypothetical protein [Bacillus subtilis]